MLCGFPPPPRLGVFAARCRTGSQLPRSDDKLFVSASLQHPVQHVLRQDEGPEGHPGGGSQEEAENDSPVQGRPGEEPFA